MIVSTLPLRGSGRKSKELRALTLVEPMINPKSGMGAMAATQWKLYSDLTLPTPAKWQVSTELLATKSVSFLMTEVSVVSMTPSVGSTASMIMEAGCWRTRRVPLMFPHNCGKSLLLASGKTFSITRKSGPKKPCASLMLKRVNDLNGSLLVNPHHLQGVNLLYLMAMMECLACPVLKQWGAIIRATPRRSLPVVTWVLTESLTIVLPPFPSTSLMMMTLAHASLPLLSPSAGNQWKMMMMIFFPGRLLMMKSCMKSA